MHSLLKWLRTLLIIIVLVSTFGILILSFIIALILWFIRGRVILVRLCVLIKALLIIWIVFSIVIILIILIIGIVRWRCLELRIRHIWIYLLLAELLSLAYINIIKGSIVNVLEVSLLFFVIFILLLLIPVILIATCALRLAVIWLPGLGFDIGFKGLLRIVIHSTIFKSGSKWVVHTFSFYESVLSILVTIIISLNMRILIVLFGFIILRCERNELFWILVIIIWVVLMFYALIFFFYLFLKYLLWFLLFIFLFYLLTVYFLELFVISKILLVFLIKFIYILTLCFLKLFILEISFFIIFFIFVWILIIIFLFWNILLFLLIFVLIIVMFIIIIIIFLLFSIISVFVKIFLLIFLRFFLLICMSFSFSRFHLFLIFDNLFY